jgi:hypothetical protein
MKLLEIGHECGLHCGLTWSGGIYNVDRSEILLTGRGPARSSRKNKNLMFRDKKKRKLGNLLIRGKGKSL